jgi:serine/threonine-protein kinase HipA
MTPAQRKRLFGVTWEPTLPFHADDFVRRVSDALARAPMSISGVQMKCSARLNLQTRQLDIISEQGTYILKPTPPGYPSLAVVEDLCMSLAEAQGFEVPPHGVLPMQDGTPCYIVSRFDRRANGNMVHIEDMQQILGGTDKYVGSLEAVGKALLRHAAHVGLEMVLFFERVLFNFLIGNGDMHLKNWSLIEEDDGTVRLAPCYDFVCTRLYLSDEESALTLNGKRNKLTRQDFETFAASLRIDPVAAQTSIRRLLKRTASMEATVDQTELSPDQKKRFAQLLHERASRFA